jgi:hypothetical protein
MKRKRKHNYWRVVIVYTDNETSAHRVFNGLERAKKWAARQEKSPVVKRVRIEPFVVSRIVGANVLSDSFSPTEFSSKPTDAQTSNCTGCENRGHSFRDDSVRETQQDAENQPDSPARPRQPYIANYESETKTRDERAKHGRPFVRETEGYHQGRVDAAKNESTKNA